MKESIIFAEYPRHTYYGGEVMEPITTIRKLLDIGLNLTTIGRYCHSHPNAIKYYLQGVEPKDYVVENYEKGLRQLLADIQDAFKD